MNLIVTIITALLSVVLAPLLQVYFDRVLPQKKTLIAYTLTSFLFILRYGLPLFFLIYLFVNDSIQVNKFFVFATATLVSALFMNVVLDFTHDLITKSLKILSEIIQLNHDMWESLHGQNGSITKLKEIQKTMSANQSESLKQVIDMLEGNKKNTVKKKGN